MIKFTRVFYKNFLSTGSGGVEILLDNIPSSLLVGQNGSGKCLHHSTQLSININNPDTLNKFKDYLYETQKKQDKT